MTVDLRPDTTHWLKILSGDYVIDVAVHQWTVEAPVAPCVSVVVRRSIFPLFLRWAG